MSIGPQLWPPVVEPATLTRQVWDVETACTIPGFGRGLSVYGMIAQCALDQYRGVVKMPTRPPLLELPDVNLRSLATFIDVHIKDFLVHGNAVHLVHTRLSNDAVRGVRWFPAHMWSVAGPGNTDDGGVDYYLNGRPVPRRNVVHVQRGAHPVEWWRGVGVVEQYLKTLDRAGLQEARERKNLTTGGVPSAAIIAPNPRISEDEAKEAKQDWMDKFGPGGEPGIFPYGTQITPLSWSPADSELTEARKLTLVDMANALNLDPYWLGAQSSSHTYKSPAPTFLELQRVSLEPVMTVFEQVWSALWWPPTGTTTRFDRLTLTRDDWASEVAAGIAAVNSGLISREEWRVRQGLPVEPEVGELKAAPTMPTAAPGQIPGQLPKLELLPGGSDNPDDEEGTGS